MRMRLVDHAVWARYYSTSNKIAYMTADNIASSIADKNRRNDGGRLSSFRLPTTIECKK